jgi:hypothetical protein
MRTSIARGLVIAALALALAGCATEASGTTTISSGSNVSGSSSGGSTPGTTSGSGKSKTESRHVSGFSSVVISSVGELDIQQTGTESLSITADDNVLPKLTSDVVNGVLQLGVKPNTSIQTNHPVQYHLTVKNLDGITVSGTADVTMPKLTTNTLSVEVSGSGTISVYSLSAQSARINMPGAGDITLQGQAQSQQVTIAGAGNYHGDRLTTASAVVQVSGAGDATVHITQSLDATVSGAGDIIYSGSPSQVKSTVTGSGSITKG